MRLFDYQVAIAAAREVLNRAGVTAPTVAADAGATSGQVLWEEFVEIYRRRVAQDDAAAAATIDATRRERFR